MTCSRQPVKVHQAPALGASAVAARSDAAHAKVKTEMLQLRLMEKRRELVRRDDVDALIDESWRHPDASVEPACAVRAAW